MNMVSKSGRESVYAITPVIWSLLLIAGALMSLTYFDGIKELLRIWEVKEEYSYGYMVPFITLFFIWQKKEVLEKVSFDGTWMGVLLVVFGLLLFILGELSTLYLVIQYSLVIVIFGVLLSFMGRKAFAIILVPLVILIFMIPLPAFFLREISNQLQLISSSIGVAVIRLFDISVYLEGNVIDLGSYKLQVVEACNGLRYLFPLMTLGFIAAYLYNVRLWKRVVLFLSTIPITVLMNSFRIGMIGVMVEYWGQSMAEGFLHDFEGWVIFMACTVVLVAEMWVLNKIGRDSRPLREVFGLEFPEKAPENSEVRERAIPKPFILSVLVIAIVAGASFLMPERTDIIPERKAFADFPMHLGEWKGREDRLEQIYLDELKLDDYIIADYANENKNLVNFYVAYYATQKKGQSSHSPRTCMPGGGWKIQEITQHRVDGVNVGDVPLVVNRTLIQLGEHRQLVYYWFQQRSRIITNEYLVKWFIFWDALTQNRSDGALVRLTTALKPGEDLAEGDKRFKAFINEINPMLSEYVPQ